MEPCHQTCIMNLKKTTFVSALALTLSVGAAFSIFAFQAPNPTPQDINEASSININEASRLYKDYKQMQYESVEENVLDEAAYRTYQVASAILAADSTSDATADQCRGILLDLHKALARGAIHYSMKSDAAGMSRFARAYVDTKMMPQMASAQLSIDPELYPSLVYTAASSSYNAGKLNDAITYFEEYLRTGETKQREQVALFYGSTILKTEQQRRGLEAVVDASRAYPTNQQLLTIAMQLCLDTKRRDLLPDLLDRALTFKPDDDKLLNLKAQLHEEKGEYRPALDIYMRLDEMKPNNLAINESIARCYYNLATGYYNESIQSVDEKSAAKARRQSNAYFSSAAEKFEELSNNDPNNVKYLKGMATSYAILGNKSKVETINVQLQALGQGAVAMNTMPVVIGDGKAVAGGAKQRSIPSYQEYAQDYVTQEMAKWAKRGEFEKVEDYNKRTSAQGILAEQKRLSAITADKYLKEYAGNLMPTELKLQPYDVENETYAVNSDFGPVYVKVPLKNKEAETFKNSWEQIQIRNVKYFIKDDKIAISTITFHSPSGKDYTFNSSSAVAYEPPVVNVDPEKFRPKTTESEPAKEKTTPAVQVKKQVESDVDKNIPQSNSVNSSTLAFIIANENYSKVSEVSSAIHDGEVFAQYCRETLGIPQNQVLLFKNAGLADVMSAVNRLKNSVNAMGAGTDVIVYYAGHGVPDEATKDAYLLPVDADPQVMATAYPLSKFYQELGDMGADNVMVFMDACFSGANRGDGMLAEARGVVLKAKPAAPKGSMFVLSAADGNETALPWKEKNHGLFTYYLLKKLQDSKGNATLQEIADYVSSEVRKTASLQLNKPQTPKVTTSGTLATELSKKKLRK